MKRPTFDEARASRIKALAEILILQKTPIVNLPLGDQTCFLITLHKSSGHVALCISCTANDENKSKWLLGEPLDYDLTLIDFSNRVVPFHSQEFYSDELERLHLRIVMALCDDAQCNKNTNQV